MAAFKINISIACLFIFFPVLNLSAQYLHTQGQEIVDGDGNPFLLRGIGPGGWLVPEGYMLHIPGYGSPASIRNMIQDLIGEQAAGQFYQKYRENYVNADDIALIARWGFNSIRLPFHYDLLTPRDQPGVFLEEGFAVLDSVLAWCARNQLYLILDMHAAPGGQNHLNISDSDGEAKLWTIPENQDRTVEIWREIARRHADEKWIGGYDLLNEPVLPDGFNNTHLRNLYMRIASAVHEFDNNHIIFIEGNFFATNFDLLTPPILYGKNIVYSFHKYWNSPTVETIQYLLNLRSNWNVPLWLGESGENSNPWFHKVVRLMEENNIGWNWWTHKKIATITSPLSSPITPSYQQILDYWNGAADRPAVTFAREALFEMAENLALGRCDFQPDVLAALFETDFGIQHKSFVDHILPGIIDCADYDLGANNIAYYDSKSSRDRFDDGEPWNSGWSYRNDGVDIEPSKDARGAPFSVGWVEAGEWLKYTIDISEAGIYDVTFRVASLSGGGKLKLMLNGQSLTGPLAVPKTTGWYNWHSLVEQGLALPAGKHVLMLDILAGGFNINRMEFELKTSTAVETPGDSPLQFQLEQNYPNPFNPETVFNYQLSAISSVELTIYDLLGEKIVTLVDSKQPAGIHTVIWDGRDFAGNRVASGVYLYELRAGDFVDAKKMLLLR